MSNASRAAWPIRAAHQHEVTEWHKTQQLSENRLAAIHDLASFAKKIGNDTRQKSLPISNRRNQRSRQTLVIVGLQLSDFKIYRTDVWDFMNASNKGKGPATP